MSTLPRTQPLKDLATLDSGWPELPRETSTCGLVLAGPGLRHTVPCNFRKWFPISSFLILRVGQPLPNRSSMFVQSGKIPYCSLRPQVVPWLVQT